MKSQCSNKCIRAYNMMQETSLISIIKDFVYNLTNLDNDSLIIQQFYDYVKMKYKIPCETGMLFIEKMTMINIFDKLKIKVGSINQMVNDKIKLYQWIKPYHLGINTETNNKDINHNINNFNNNSSSNCNKNCKKIVTGNDIDDKLKIINKNENNNFVSFLDNLKKMEKTDLPSVKIFYLMKFIDNLYNKIGRNSDHDTFFTNLVYYFIKSEVEDLYAHLIFIKIFKRKYENNCKFGCNHGFQVLISCDCLISENWNLELDYYITTCLAAIDFISKIEYYNLKVNFQEFENEIISRMSNIKINTKTNENRFFEVEK